MKVTGFCVCIRIIHIKYGADPAVCNDRFLDCFVAARPRKLFKISRTIPEHQRTEAQNTGQGEPLKFTLVNG